MMEKRARFDLKQRDKTPTKWHPPLVEVNQAVKAWSYFYHGPFVTNAQGDVIKK